MWVPVLLHDSDRIFQKIKKYKFEVVGIFFPFVLLPSKIVVARRKSCSSSILLSTKEILLKHTHQLEPIIIMQGSDMFWTAKV